MNKIILILIGLIASFSSYSNNLDDYIGYWKSDNVVNGVFVSTIPMPKVAVIIKKEGIYYYNENAINEKRVNVALNTVNEKLVLPIFNVQFHLSDDKNTLAITDSIFTRITKDKFYSIQSLYFSDLEEARLQQSKKKADAQEREMIRQLEVKKRRLLKQEEEKRNTERCKSLKTSMKEEMQKNKLANDYMSMSRDNVLRKETKNYYKKNKKIIKNKYSTLKSDVPRCR
jgi:hypothetical protein